MRYPRALKLLKGLRGRISQAAQCNRPADCQPDSPFFHLDSEAITEFSIDLTSLTEWLALRERNHTIFEHEYHDKLGQSIALNGCVEPLTGTIVTPDQIYVGSSLRESLSYRGVNSRVRAVMHAIENILSEGKVYSPRIFATEGVTAFALRMRGLYPHFLGSEFTMDLSQREQLYPIPFEDLQNLTLRSNAFDIVSTNEVLEHVPSIDEALRELHRVLRPGGWHIGTLPFGYFQHGSVRRAEVADDGNIVHLLEPEYHGDPMNGDGVLVFETPGWDIIDRAREAGFSRAFMRFVISAQYGIASEHIGGIFVFCCQK